MSEVGVHHVGIGGVLLVLAVNDDVEQFAHVLCLVMIEHFHGDEVVGR